MVEKKYHPAKKCMHRCFDFQTTRTIIIKWQCQISYVQILSYVPCFFFFFFFLLQLLRDPAKVMLMAIYDDNEDDDDEGEKKSDFDPMPLFKL